MNPTLPDKASQLIRLAIRDLELVERKPYYSIDMSQWHHHNGDNACEVCLAGSVMAMTLGASFDSVLSPEYWDDSIASKLYALDLFRRGNVIGGLKAMLVWRDWRHRDYEVTPYERNPAGFKADMLAMADRLENQGL